MPPLDRPIAVELARGRGSAVSQRSRDVLARDLGLPVSVEQIDVQSPRHGEVMIRLAACGVCHSDLSATNGTIAYPLPLVLGHEGAGIVTAVGEGVSRYAIGDHVVSSFEIGRASCRERV